MGVRERPVEWRELERLPLRLGFVLERQQGTAHAQWEHPCFRGERRLVTDAATVTQSHHDRNARLALALRYARLCQVIASQGPTVVMATISLFREVHAWNRDHLPGYFELYLKVPLDEPRRRDPKGLCQRFGLPCKTLLTIAQTTRYA